MTYWQLNAFFLAIAAVLAIGTWKRLPLPAIGMTAAVLLVMTAVFDNIMIGIGLVAYNPDLIGGQFVGVAPLEDFAYALAAIVGLPSLWVLLGRPSTGSGTASTGSGTRFDRLRD